MHINKNDFNQQYIRRHVHLFINGQLPQPSKQVMMAPTIKRHSFLDLPNERTLAWWTKVMTTGLRFELPHLNSVRVIGHDSVSLNVTTFWFWRISRWFLLDAWGHSARRRLLCRVQNDNILYADALACLEIRSWPHQGGREQPPPRQQLLLIARRLISRRGLQVGEEFKCPYLRTARSPFINLYWVWLIAKFIGFMLEAFLMTQSDVELAFSMHREVEFGNRIAGRAGRQVR